MSLLIRLDREEAVLRSVGDPPHGIVGHAQVAPDRSAWIIDGTFQPKPMPAAPGIVVNTGKPWKDVEAGDQVVPVDTVELVDACESENELRHLAYGCQALVLMYAEKAIKAASPTALNAAARFFEETLDAIRTRVEREQ